MRKLHRRREIVNLLKTEPDSKLRQAPLGLVQMEFLFINFLAEEKFPTKREPSTNGSLQDPQLRKGKICQSSNDPLL
jgi:hypothetical protein